MKHCKICNKFKLLTDFNKQSSEVDGLCRYCRECVRDKLVKKAELDGKKLNRRIILTDEERRQRRRDKKKRYYEKYPEKRREERKRQKKRYYQRYPEKKRESNNKNKKAKQLIQKSIREMRRRHRNIEKLIIKERKELVRYRCRVEKFKRDIIKEYNKTIKSSIILKPKAQKPDDLLTSKYNKIISTNDGKLKNCCKCKSKLFYKEFTKYHNNICFYCLNGRTVEEYIEYSKLIKKLRDKTYKRIKKTKQQRELKEWIGDSIDKGGYIYMMYSSALNIYKVGVSHTPFVRLKSLSYTEYGINDLKILCVGVPKSRSFDAESNIHIELKKYKYEFLKPCGGWANELFSCDLITITNIFKNYCQSWRWLDKTTEIFVS